MKNKVNYQILFKRLKHSFKNIGSDADKDWNIIILTFFVVFLGAVIFHINLFINVQARLDNNVGSLESKNQSINSEDLSEMVGKYEKRAEEYEKIEDIEFQLIDPS